MGSCAGAGLGEHAPAQPACRLHSHALQPPAAPACARVRACACVCVRVRGQDQSAARPPGRSRCAGAGAPATQLASPLSARASASTRQPAPPPARNLLLVSARPPPGTRTPRGTRRCDMKSVGTRGLVRGTAHMAAECWEWLGLLVGSVDLGIGWF